VLAALFALAGAVRDGVVRLRSLVPWSSESNTDALDKEAGNLVKSLAFKPGDEVPFETEQLARYYAQTLSQSKTSFWFSLVFASIGFLVIIAAVFLTGMNSLAALQAFAGVVMNAVAGLFFVQSQRAQVSMGAFFDKLRDDRLHLESRKMCEAIENDDRRDQMRITLGLAYAGLSSDALAPTVPASVGSQSEG